jgi:hypothetical protein
MPGPIVVSTHDLGLVGTHFGRCVALNRTIVGDGTPAQVLGPRAVSGCSLMPDVAGWLIEPYASGLMQRAPLASLLLGVIAPLVGVWIVLRRLAYLGDATLGGVAVAYLAGWSITVGAIAAGLLMAALMALLVRHSRLREDPIIATVAVALFATAIILISSHDSIGVDLSHRLFGSITTVTTENLTLNAVLGTLVLIGLFAIFADLRSAPLTRCTQGSSASVSGRCAAPRTRRLPPRSSSHCRPSAS